MANMPKVDDHWLLTITRANQSSAKPYSEKLLTNSKYMDADIWVSVPSVVGSVSAAYATLTSAGSSATTVTSQYFKITPSYSVTTAG